MSYSFDEIEETTYIRSIDEMQKALIKVIWARVELCELQAGFKYLLNPERMKLDTRDIENRLSILKNKPEEKESFWLLIAFQTVFMMNYQNRDNASEQVFFVFECLERIGAIDSQLYGSFMNFLEDG
ncbi:MAG: hypothetical protein ABJN14_01720 [Paracoccaceae bacterium]